MKHKLLTLAVAGALLATLSSSALAAPQQSITPATSITDSEIGPLDFPEQIYNLVNGQLIFHDSAPSAGSVRVYTNDYNRIGLKVYIKTSNSSSFQQIYATPATPGQWYGHVEVPVPQGSYQLKVVSNYGQNGSFIFKTRFI